MKIFVLFILSAVFSFDAYAQKNAKAIDLGLSVKWADRNVGAKAPEGVGMIVTWGETEEKAVYTVETAKYMGGDNYRYRKYASTTDPDASYPEENDDLLQLEPQDDVATHVMGTEWRMPTHQEMNELYSKCTFIFTEKSDCCGYTVKGPNGNSIFLPMTGYCAGNKHIHAERVANYWTSTKEPYNSDTAYSLYFTKKRVNAVERFYRVIGSAVRAVTTK